MLEDINEEFSDLNVPHIKSAIGYGLHLSTRPGCGLGPEYDELQREFIGGRTEGRRRQKPRTITDQPVHRGHVWT